MDIVDDRDRRAQPGDGFPVEGTAQPADAGQEGEGLGSEPRTVLDETTPADRAGWEAALADEANRGPEDRAAGEGTGGTGKAADQPAAVPEYEEDHPITSRAGQDDLSVADLRPEVEGETIPEQARRRSEGSG